MLRKELDRKMYWFFFSFFRKHELEIFEHLDDLYFMCCRSNYSSAASSALVTDFEIELLQLQFLFCVYLWPR